MHLFLRDYVEQLGQFTGSHFENSMSVSCFVNDPAKLKLHPLNLCLFTQSAFGKRDGPPRKDIYFLTLLVIAVSVLLSSQSVWSIRCSSVYQ